MDYSLKVAQGIPSAGKFYYLFIFLADHNKNQ